MGSRATNEAGAGRRRVAVRAGVVAVAAALTATGGAGVALASPDALTQRVAGLDGVSLTAAQLAQVREQVAGRRDGNRPAGLPDSGPASFFIELVTPASGQVYTDTLPQAGPEQAAAAATAAQDRSVAAADQVIAQLPAAVPDASVLYTTSTVLSGVAVTADAGDYETLTGLGGVSAVHPITPKTVTNAGAAGVVQAVEAWQAAGNTGAGVSIGVIDTGIDYTHADFGGSGSVEQFAALQQYQDQPAPAGVFPSAKVVGGHDFVGDDYDADPTSPAYQPVARPDPNPLDCNGHGTHVAGTAAGFGVNADGSTYTGGYTGAIDPATLRIGPGTAPEADLYALKVFGCEGSTDVTIQAIDWALDPNGDGDPSDHLDVVNLSLGSDYGLADDADAMAANAAMEAGMLVVLAAGNAGDSYDIGGSPGNAPRGIGVAATNDGFGVFDGLLAPGVLEGVRPGLRSVAYTGTADLTGELVATPADNADACAPLPAGYATGRVLLVQAARFTCGSVTKGTNAVAAGAVGFVIAGDDDLLETGITGVPDVPGILVGATDGAALTAAVAAGQPVTVTFGPSLEDAAVVDVPGQVDLLASFSSRGTRQADGLKPDVAAPGVTLYSAEVGAGSGGVSTSGTSMASPVAAGVTALIRAAHPDWTTEEVKADLMNTAGHDVFTGEGRTGERYGPNRVGAGRIDALQAVQNDVLAYAEAGSGVVSASFGVVEVATEQVQAVKTVTVANKGSGAAVYRVAYQALAEQPGVRYSLSAQRVTVPPGQTRTVTVTMTATQDELRRVGDPTLVTGDGRQVLGEASGRVVFVPVGGRGHELRVPVHANAEPSSTLTATADPAGTAITLTGAGVANGEAYTPDSYTSLVSAFEGLGTSPVMERCTTEVRPDCYKSELERSVDLARVGVASDVRDPAFADDPGLYFAVSAHGRFTSAETTTNYGVYVDADADGAWDYQVTTTRIPDYDVPLVVVTDRSYQLLPAAAPFVGALNVFDGEVDTNALDSDVQVLGVPVSAMPLVQGRISFGVQAISAYGTVDDLGTAVDPNGEAALTTPMSFDPLAPGLSFTDEDGVAALFTPATDGTRLTVTQDAASYAADVAVGGDKDALVVLSHNDTATGRTQSVGIAPAAAVG